MAPAKLTAEATHDRSEESRTEGLGGALGGLRETGARLRFLLVFWALSGALLFAHHYPYPQGTWGDRFVTGYCQACAWLVGGILRTFGDPVLVYGDTVVHSARMSITKDCDGLELVGFLVSAVVAFPSTWKERSRGVAFALAAAIGLNLVRLCTLYVILARWPSLFEFFHVQAWQVLSFVAGLALFGAWVRILRAERRPG